MKQQIKIGGRDVELDLLTKEELHAEIEQLVSGYLRPPSQARPEGGAVLSAGGAGVADIYTVPLGMQFRLTRLFVTVNAAQFSAPVALTGGIDVFRGVGSESDEIDGTSFNSVPQVATWNRSNGPLFREGENVRIGIVAGATAANGQFFCRGAGFLEPLIDNPDRQG